MHVLFPVECVFMLSPVTKHGADSHACQSRKVVGSDLRSGPLCCVGVDLVQPLRDAGHNWKLMFS